MTSLRHVVLLYLLYLHSVFAVKVKVIMHSDEDSRPDEEDHTEVVEKDRIILPFLKKRGFETEQTEKPKSMHPNELIFPLIYRQNHISSMFKFGENWYTWSSEKRTDGSRATNYYICYDEPKHCDEIGWVRGILFFRINQKNNIKFSFFNRIMFFINYVLLV